MRRMWIVLPTLALGILAACSSDPKDPYSYASGNVPCTTAADCCVVYDTCLATGLVVGKGDVLRVQGLLADANAPDAGKTCVRCVAPAVEVKCESSKCVGYVVPGDPSTLPAELSKDHCGAGNVPASAKLVTSGARLSCP